jgi:hypothetical protein
MPSCCRAVDDAKQSPDGKTRANLEPRLQSIPGPVIHPDLAAPAALAAADEDGASGSVEVALGEVKRLADSQTGTPQDHHQRPQASAVRPITAARMTATISSILGGSAG